MKKLLTILLALLTIISLAGCQKKQIVAMINVDNGDDSGTGMQAEMPENSTLKDLFDALAQGGDFVYELDGDGNILTVNGKGNDEMGYWEVLLNGEILDDVIAKTALKDGDVCSVAYIPNTSNAIVGGWVTAEVARTELTEEEEENFKKAMEVVLGETYEPVCVLATQVVSGTNYAYLGRGTTVTAEPVSNFFIVKIYQDLEGNVKLESISEINIMEIATADGNAENVLGGWQLTDTGKPGTLGSEEAQSSFEKALSEIVGVTYNPIQLLASQIVSGTNYIALARGRVSDAEGTLGLYVITWYADLEGNSKVSDIKKFNLNYYVD